MDVTCQAPLFMGVFWQEYWSGLPFPSPEVLPNPGIEPGSQALQADTLTSDPPGKPNIIPTQFFLPDCYELKTNKPIEQTDLV